MFQFNGSDNNSGLNWDEALLTLSEAASRIYTDKHNRNYIYIDNGVYSPSNTEEKIFHSLFFNTELIGKENTVLDAENNGQIIYNV